VRALYHRMLGQGYRLGGFALCRPTGQGRHGSVCGIGGVNHDGDGDGAFVEIIAIDDNHQRVRVEGSRQHCPGAVYQSSLRSTASWKKKISSHSFPHKTELQIKFKRVKGQQLSIQRSYSTSNLQLQALEINTVQTITIKLLPPASLKKKTGACHK
jgi:hypothetical protein